MDMTPPVRIDMLGSNNKWSALILCDRNRRQLHTSLRLCGHSMRPLLPHDTVLTCSLADDIRIGDVVVFRRADRLVAHRVVDIYVRNKQRFYIEKGDNTLAYSTLKREDVLGKVIAVDDQKKWLPYSSYTFFANYIVAKVSYATAIITPIATVIPRYVFRYHRFSKIYIRTWIRIGNWISRHIALLLLGFASYIPLNND